MNNYPDLEQEEIPLSRTKKKEQVEALQELGIELTKYSKDKLAKLDLPTELLEAIKQAQKLTANVAVRRQYQYIGKLMRNVDADEIRIKLDYANGDSVKATQVLHIAERWRDQLLEDDAALDNFIAVYSGFDIADLRSLVRSVRRERELQKNRNFTKLFRLIRTIVEENS